MSAEEKQQEQQAASAGEAQASLLDEIIEATRVKPSDETYEITKRGVRPLLMSF